MWTDTLTRQLNSSLDLLRKENLPDDMEEEIRSGIKMTINELTRLRTMEEIEKIKESQIKRDEERDQEIIKLKQKISSLDEEKQKLKDSKRSDRELIRDKQEALIKFKEQERRAEALLDENCKLIRKIDYYIKREVRIGEILRAYDVDFILQDLDRN